MNLAQALFAPRAVALIGASGDAGKNTARPQRFMRKHGYTGRILPINPGRSEILGEPAYASLADAPGEIDHAFIMVPGAQVGAVLEQCAARGVPLATIYSDGFAETGPEGAARERALTERARALGVRVIGPNSIGVANVLNGATLTVNAIFEMDALPKGAVSVVSQSGTMIGTLLSRGAARGLGFAKLVSVGNESDVGVGELVGVLAADTETKVILLFLETLRDAERLAQAARAAQAAGKAVVAYKLGRSALGEALARSHTGALAGSDAAVDAFFRAHGIVRVDMLETLVEIAPLLSGRKPPFIAQGSGQPRRQPKVAVVTTTGGGAASVVDRLGTLGIGTLVPDDALIGALKEKGLTIRSAPIIDLTLAATSDKYRAVLEALLAHPDCDAALAVVGSSAQFHPDLAVKPIVGVARSDKPLVAFLAPHAEASLRLLAAVGVPAFRTPEACADALAAYFRWQAPRPDNASQAENASQATAWPQAVPQSGTLNEDAALSLFESLGVATVERQIALMPQFHHTLAYPVAVKVLSADILHKTEVGGVALGIGDRAAFDARVRELLDRVRAAAPQARIDGLLVQSMAGGLAEAIVGYRHDPMVGPLVLVGLGGQLAEVYRDTALACAPVAEAQALAMLDEVKGFALLRGYRNLPRGDLRALAQAVAAVSRLALLPGQPVEEAEINPLIVRAEGSGVIAVDGLVTLKESA